MHFVFPGKERLLGCGRSPAFRLDTPTPGPPPKGARSPVGTWRSPYRLAPEVGAEKQRVKALIAAARRGGGPSPGLSPTWLHFFGRKTSQALRTLGAPLPAAGAGAPAHFRALGLAGASPALRSRTARGGRGSSGLIQQACRVAQWSVTETNPQSRSTLPSAWRAWDRPGSPE